MHPVMEFHVSRVARNRYRFDDYLFAFNGSVIFANFHAARVFAQRMNDQRDLIRFPEQAVSASQINAMGLIDELLHYLMKSYREQQNPTVLKDALAWVDEALEPDQVEKALRQFCHDFPPVPVYRGEMTVDEYMAAATDGMSHREALLEELIFLWLSNNNPALVPFSELFDDDELSKRTAYRQLMSELDDFFDEQPGFGPGGQKLLDLLQEPARRHPHSLTDQLEFMRQSWGGLIGGYLYRLLSSLDLIAEEERIYFGVGGGPQKGEVLDFHAVGSPEDEPEQFSSDLHWMPRLVLIAKNAYVWLDQLSKEYEREIRTLDKIPDEELDFLANAGITGLWLIGLWERSEASRRIKHRMGNPDAVASAYSLDDYAIATALGGDEAYEQLRERARQRGVRMATDMVPNHMGIDSRWVVEHPDWFISLPYSPYPTYSFQSEDLSDDARVGIFLEDHYYNHSDAAVVFKRVDRWTGDERYIYHGNDGTSMPWNDTAQLDFLNPEVREAVIQTILHVARKSSVIRFDAAMVLAKRHIQRLWYPEPGSGGGIPSRAEFAMTKEAFNDKIPVEFWREVVDRVAAEEPDTLLLAEAFWMMEGYFVRTLGMHRVYNSAFMHMLRDEDNANYRMVMKNTLEFNPEILKRYVNFMSNPDEETAEEQFGKGDKYFGVATIMATLPGLPMIGHGQIEGFTEKYGMEYQRAYFDEKPDQYLVERHKQELFPLFERRHLFAEVENFLLYDFQAPEGHVNEDVFAYSNSYNGDRSLVIYHNRWAEAAGWIRRSVGFAQQSGPGADDKQIVQRSLQEGLGLTNDSNRYLIFRDHITNLEYIRSCRQLCEEGLYVEVGGYKCHVFLDFREVADDETRRYARLHGHLNGRGVPSVEEALRELGLEPVLNPFRKLTDSGNVRRILAARQTSLANQTDLLEEITEEVIELLTAIHTFAESEEPESIIQETADEISLILAAALQIEEIADEGVLEVLPAGLTTEPADGDLSQKQDWSIFLGWLFTHALGRLVVPPEQEPALQSRTWLDEWFFGRNLQETMRDLGLDEGQAHRAVQLIKLLTTHQTWPADETATAYTLLSRWLRDGDIRSFLQVNRHQELLWFNKESFAELRAWMVGLAAARVVSGVEEEPETVLEEPPALDDARRMVAAMGLMQQLAEAEEESEYQVEKLLDAARDESVVQDEADASS